MSGFRSFAKSMVPPVALSAVGRLMGRPAVTARTYQGVTTIHDMSAMHSGRFAECFARGAAFDPYVNPESTRLRVYLACCFAAMASTQPGDFLFCGISYGVAPWVVYNYLESRRVLHLVDPFVGVDGAGHTRPTYNADPDLVREQYPKEAPVTIHRGFIPDAFPLAGIDRTAFIELNTGNRQAEAKSLGHLYERLSPGGILMIDAYAIGSGEYRSLYDSALAAAGMTAYTMVTGQGVVQKPLRQPMAN